MQTVAFNQLESFVKQQKAQGVNVKLDGYDVVFFIPNKRGVYTGVHTNTHGTIRTTGAFDRATETWGIESRISCDNFGKWRVPERVVRRTNSIRT